MPAAGGVGAPLPAASPLPAPPGTAEPTAPPGAFASAFGGGTFAPSSVGAGATLTGGVGVAGSSVQPAARYAAAPSMKQTTLRLPFIVPHSSRGPPGAVRSYRSPSLAPPRFRLIPNRNLVRRAATFFLATYRVCAALRRRR
ncbi:hypothetical protein [Paenibacillus elgii]|uniref:hypothetical protein n=1 Tax=Paenibacillus elgii TaxID=189691 RepID=UPI0030DD8AB2